MPVIRSSLSGYLGKKRYYGHTFRGGQGHLMLRDLILPQSEVIRAILLEYSLCCGVPHLIEEVVDHALEDVLKGAQSEVIRAI